MTVKELLLDRAQPGEFSRTIEGLKDGVYVAVYRRDYGRRELVGYATKCTEITVIIHGRKEVWDKIPRYTQITGAGIFRITNFYASVRYLQDCLETSPAYITKNGKLLAMFVSNLPPPDGTTEKARQQLVVQSGFSD